MQWAGSFEIHLSVSSSNTALFQKQHKNNNLLPLCQQTSLKVDIFFFFNISNFIKNWQLLLDSYSEDLTETKHDSTFWDQKYFTCRL